MRLLVDTCTFLWWAADDPKLSPAAREHCTDPRNEVFLSSVSAWEIALKHGLGRLPLPEPPQTWVPSRRAMMEVEALPFSEDAACHAYLLADHHRDPFDRALISQASVEVLGLVRPDAIPFGYSGSRRWGP